MISPGKLVPSSFNRAPVFGLILFIATFFIYGVFQGVQADELDNAFKVEGDYCTLYFVGNVDFNELDKHLNIRFVNISEMERRALRTTSSISKRIALKCDIILLRSEQILDMYPADFHVNVVFYETTEMLDDAYEEIMSERRHLYSYYVYENNTIYTTQSRINENVLGHEFGHAIVNHYFIVRPPETVRELLSQYVDYHLND